MIGFQPLKLLPLIIFTDRLNLADGLDLLSRYLFAHAEYVQPLNDCSQLSNVARPVASVHQIHSFRGKLQCRLLIQIRKLVVELL